MNRPGTVAMGAACLLVVLLAGCARKGPLSVRFTRQVDETRLAELPVLGGSAVLLIDHEFWTDQDKVRGIPVVRREKTFIIGPGAAEMAEKMLSRVFDEVVSVRLMNEVDDAQRFDYVIRLYHESFDDTTLYLPLFSYQRYRVGLGAEISRAEGSFLGNRVARGADGFWLASLLPTDPQQFERPMLDKASKALNEAVQESLFGLMEELELLLAVPQETH